jgi:HSP20 family protein
MVERNAAQESSKQKQPTQPESKNKLQAGSSGAIEKYARSRSIGFGMPQLLVDPFSIFRSMYEEMNRMLGPSGRTTGNGSSHRMDTFTAWMPTIEVDQRGDKYVVSAELPGIEASDVNVEVDDDVLVFQGQRQHSQEETQGGIRRSERRYGQFYRSVPLPQGIDPNQGRAQMNNGVLEVSFPLTEVHNDKKQIPVIADRSQSEQGKQSRSEGSKAA